MPTTEFLVMNGNNEAILDDEDGGIVAADVYDMLPGEVYRFLKLRIHNDERLVGIGLDGRLAAEYCLTGLGVVESGTLVYKTTPRDNEWRSINVVSGGLLRMRIAAIHPGQTTARFFGVAIMDYRKGSGVRPCYDLASFSSP